jgi:Flp pilus assembly protein TadG
MTTKSKIRTSLTEGNRTHIPPVGVVLRSQSGQTLLEVALLTPLLLLLLLGVIEMGRYAYLGILVGNAARAGAAYGAQSYGQAGDGPGIQAAADNDYQYNGQLTSTLTVTSSTYCGCDSAGTITARSCGTPTCASGHAILLLSVTTSGTYSSLFNYPGIPSPITVTRTATLRVAQ